MGCVRIRPRGNELFDLFAVPAQGGDVINLTATDSVSEASAYWSPTGKLLAFERKPKDRPATDIAILDWSTRSIRQLTHEETQDHSWEMIAWSANGRLVYANRCTLDDCSAWSIDVNSGAAQELTPHVGAVRISLTAVSPDGRWMAVTSNAVDGRPQAALFDPVKRRYKWLRPSPWETHASEFSPDGRHLVWMLNADGRCDVFIYDLASGVSRRIKLPPGFNWIPSDGRIFSRDGHILVRHQASNTPLDYWIADISGDARQLTHSSLASLEPTRLPAAQLVHYRSFDGTVISAYLWLPFNLQRNGHAAGVVLPHGGPVGQTIDTFNRTATALASRGYVCIAPNVRGSTGYGMAFQKANLGDLGGADLQDLVCASRFLVATGYVDAGRIGITGGSYGGYLTLMALGKTPQLWRAGVDEYGIFSWTSILRNEDPALQEYDKALLGDPIRDKEKYDSASPITYIKQISAPLLVLHGDNDVRVPKEESEQAVAMISAQHGTVEAHYYPAEGHGFSKRENQIDALERTVGWFDRYLGTGLGFVPR
jgi:dipeptidyl aminopeptidase/acylaminoacyl peptidase